MKILIYNWAQFDNALLVGGGVSVYLRNTIEEMLSRENVEIYFLSSGDEYGFFRRKPRIRQTKNAYDNPRLKTFAIVNSPIKAPAHDAFHAIDVWLRDTKTVQLIERFAAEHGPFDAMHIHGLEGISGNLLSMTKTTNIKKMFYTFHNYMPMCPQIELLYDGRQNCDDYRHGQRCVSCLRFQRPMTNLIAFHRMGWILKNRGLSGHPIGDFLFGAYAGFRAFVDAFRNLANNLLLGARTGFRHWRLHQRNPVGRPESWAQIEDTRAIAPQNLQPTMRHPTFYKQWRESNGHALRQNFDQLFAVSDLANTTVAKFLPPGSEIETLPLPIDVELSDEERQKLDRLREAKDGMTLSFFGYDIASKGLPFLIDALSQIDDPFYANSVDLLIVSRLTPHRDRQLRLLEGRFRTVRVVPGYSRRQLPSLAAQIDLNIVPSIWRETFNQTTVELARLGVPSLVSSHVGAKQTLPHHDRFVFAAEDAMDFGKQLDQLVRDKSRRDSFFETALDMPSIADHVDRLMYHYGKGQPSGAG